MIQNDALTVTRSIADVRRLVGGWRMRGLTVGLVPTMGWLHDGHLALIDRARAENDRVLATIFVNPLQFAPDEDFAAYPRDSERDFNVLHQRRCDAVFAPDRQEMFPEGTGSIDEAWTRLTVPALAGVLCGGSRPGHFDGVATIVMKLFMIAQPDAAYFGEKDYQQLTIVKRFVRDLGVPVRVEGVPIVREPDGLALSSRNGYLNAEQRRIAPGLFAALLSMRRKINATGADVPGILAAGRARLLVDGFDRVDYLTLAASDTLATLKGVVPAARIFAAAWLGRTRLIDNIPARLDSAAELCPPGEA